jgi:hypothetical protein
MRNHLRSRDLLDDATEQRFEEEAAELATSGPRAIYDAPHGDPLELFDHVTRPHGPISPRSARSCGPSWTPATTTGVRMTVTLAQAINRALADAMEADDRVLVLR